MSAKLGVATSVAAHYMDVRWGHHPMDSFCVDCGRAMVVWMGKRCWGCAAKETH